MFANGLAAVVQDRDRSPNREETTRIMFFRNRGYRHREFGRRHGYARNLNSVISIDSSRSSILPDVASRAPETAQVFIDKGQPLKLRVFVDKSVVEVFVNGKQCVAQRVRGAALSCPRVHSLIGRGPMSWIDSRVTWQDSACTSTPDLAASLRECPKSGSAA